MDQLGTGTCTQGTNKTTTLQMITRKIPEKYEHEDHCNQDKHDVHSSPLYGSISQ